MSCCNKNRTNKQIDRMQKIVLSQWDKLSDADLERLSDTLSDLQNRIEDRMESARKHREKRWKKPLVRAYKEQRKTLDDLVNRTGEQISERTQQWSEHAQQTGEQVEHVAARAEELAKERPAYGLAAGMIVGALLTLAVMLRLTARE